MVDIKQNDPSAETVRNRGRAAVNEAVAATMATGQAAAQGAEQVAEHGREAARQGAEGASEAMHRSAEIGHRGAEAMAEDTRQGIHLAAAGQHGVMRHAAEELQQASRSLAAIAEETAQGLRHFMAMPGSRGMHDTRVALQHLVEGVVQTNLRATQELMRRNGPSAIIEFQRNFVRDYFNTLAEGGAVLLRAARQAADESLAPLEQEVQRRRQSRRPGRVADVMSTEVQTVGPEDTVQQAAKLMGGEDTGALPVREGDRLIGMVTDRDLALRLAAEGRDPTRTKVREVMSPEIRYVYEDEPLDHVADNMAEQKLRRMPVMNRDKQLVGILSLGDLAGHGEPANRALQGVSPAA